MELQEILNHITDRYSAAILNWAVSRTGSRHDGETLASDVLYQVFLAASRQGIIEKPEHFVWKIAHYVWCNHLRAKARQSNEIPLQESMTDPLYDLEEDCAEESARSQELSCLRRAVADLSRLQREALILHHLEGLPLRAVAEMLNISPSAVKLRLFDARKTMKKELATMKDSTSFLYRPGRLMVGLTGDGGPDPDTRKINDSLIRQNICLLCYKGGKTIDELAGFTGIPKPYLEYDLDWLVNREFLVMQGKRYSTNFAIADSGHDREIGALYSSTRSDYVDRIVASIAEGEDLIRGIGFYGCDFPMDRLLWSMLMLYTFVFSRSPICMRLKQMDERAIRPDGGKYYVLASDVSDGKELYSHEGWRGFNGIHCCQLFDDRHESALWLGVYNFENNEPDVIRTSHRLEAQQWHRLLCDLIRPGFNANELHDDDKERLALAVARGMVLKKGSEYKPQTVIMTHDQFDRLKNQLYSPLIAKMQAMIESLDVQISAIHLRNTPNQAKGYIDYLTYVDLWKVGLYSLMFSAADGRLFMPKTPDEGTPLTMVLFDD